MIKKDFFVKYKYSFIYGIFGCLGFFCLFSWVAIVSFHEISKYPYEYPLSILLGLISFIVCSIAFIFNIKYIEHEKNKLKYVFYELLFTIVSFILTFIIIVVLSNILKIG